MHPNAQRVQRALAALGSDAQVVEMPDSTRTAVEAARAIGTTVEQIAKSLVFVDAADSAVLAIVSGGSRLSTRKLAEHLGSAVRRPDADGVRRLVGYPIGGVPPVGHEKPIRTIVDQDLGRYDEIWAAAGTPHAVFRTTFPQLLRLTGGHPAALKEEPGGAPPAP